MWANGLASGAADYAVVPSWVYPVGEWYVAFFLIVIGEASFGVEQKPVFRYGTCWASLTA